MKTYGLYDLKDNECLVMIGSIEEVAKYTDKSVGTLRTYMSRNLKVSRRYEVVRLEEE